MDTAGIRKVTDVAGLRAVIDEPHPAMAGKAIDHVDAGSREFLDASPFYLLATAGPDGSLDVSPRGEAPPAATVLDSGRTLALPERRGNRRLDSLRNILHRPRAGLLFLVPGVEHSLRVNGDAAVSDDPGLLDLLARGESPPALAVLVRIEELFVHCGRALKHSSLWDTASWPDPSPIPGTGDLLRSQAAAGRLGRVGRKEHFSPS